MTGYCGTVRTVTIDAKTAFVVNEEKGAANDFLEQEVTPCGR